VFQELIWRPSEQFTKSPMISDLLFGELADRVTVVGVVTADPQQTFCNLAK
jgi:hypothetical protein